MIAANEHRHQVFGLSLALPYASRVMPVAPSAALAVPADARVTLGRVRAHLPNPLAALDVPEFNARVEAGSDGEVLWLRRSARFLIRGGDTVTLEPLNGQPPAALYGFIEHYCLPALLIQRGLVALHANALAGPRGALVLMGVSGAGKSTLHAALMRRGLPMLSDDVAALRLEPDGQVWVLAGARHYRLCADAVSQATPVAERLRPLAGGPRRKVLARAPLSAFQAEPAPLAAIYVLEPHDGADLSLEPVRGVEKFRLLANGSFPPLSSSTYQPAHLAAIQRLLPQVTIIRLRRPRQRWTVEELADAIAGRGLIWLASYPKSGNTWTRAFLANYLGRAEAGPADINHLSVGTIASDRPLFDEVIGVEAASLRPAEVLALRPEVYRFLARQAAQVSKPLFIKVHDAWQRLPSGQGLFPASATRGVIYVVRNPLDVAVSLAHHLGQPLAEAVARLCDPAYAIGDPPGDTSRQLPQHLGGWGDHVRSWLDDSGLPVHVMRYEDMLADPAAAFAGLLRFAGLECDPARLEAAVKAAAFEQLQQQEAERGFRERRQSASAAFFRRGRAGGWRQSLSPEQAAQLITAHAETMRRLGYLDDNNQVPY